MKQLLNLDLGEGKLFSIAGSVVSVTAETTSGRTLTSLIKVDISHNAHPPSTSRPSEETAMEKTAKRRSSGLDGAKEELG